MDGDNIVGRGGLFLSLIDGRSWKLMTALEPVGIVLEAARDRHTISEMMLAKYDELVSLYKQFERSRSMQVLQALRSKIEQRTDADLLDSLRILDLVLACQGYLGSAARVAEHLLVIALQGDLSPADQAYRLQQALGWLSYAATIHLDDFNFVSGDIASIDLLGYRTAKIAGVENLDPRLVRHSMEVREEAVVVGQDRYGPTELKYGLPKELFGMPVRWRWNGSSCEYPQSAAGLIANVIAVRFPSLADACEEVMKRPDDVATIRALMAALDAFPDDVREEIEELTRLLAQLGDRQALLEGACYLMRRAYHDEAGDERRHSVTAILGLVAVASGARPLSDVELRREDGALDFAHNSGTFLVDEIKKYAVEVERRRVKHKAIGEQVRADQAAIDADFLPDPAESDTVDEGNEKPVVSASNASFLARRG